MPVKLAAAREGSSYTVVCSFTDEDGAALAPTSMSWTMLDPEGAEVAGEAVATPTAEQPITLDPADLDYEAGSYRRFVVTWTYDSSYGSGLTGKREARIPIEDVSE